MMKPKTNLSFPRISGAGEIKNVAYERYCLDGDQIQAPINLTSCHGHGLGQYWVLTTLG